MAQLNVRKRISGWFSTNTTSSREGVSQPTNSTKRPEWYIDGVAKCLAQARRMTSESNSTKLKLFHRQCDYLAGKLETAFKTCRESYTRSFSPEHKVECVGVLKLLYRLATEVESFIQDCCSKAAWMQAALTPATVPVRVSSWGCQLTLCTELLRNSNKVGAAWLTFTELQGLEEAELLAVKGMASDDEDALMRLLESMTSLSCPSKSNVLEREIEQVTILLERLNAIQARASLLSSNLEVWKVEGGHLNQTGVLLYKDTRSEVRKAEWFGAMEVAQKIVHNEGDDAHFKGELAVMAGLSHPNLVSFLGYTTDRRHYSIVLELMDGDLWTLMTRRMMEDNNREAPFSIWEACDFMLQVAEGVQYMHQNRVVHTDLRSMKILVRIVKDDEIEHVCAKVSGFGLLKKKERSWTYTCQTPNQGTSRWMPPELIKLPGEMPNTEDVLKYPFKGDVFSFGMLCYEIFTGNIPFSDIRNPGQVRREIVQGHRPQLPRKCPQNVKNLVELCWDPEPITRPSFAEICEELRYIRCSLLLEPPDQDSTPQPTLPVPEALDLPEKVSKFKGEYSALKVVRQLGKGGSDIVTVYLSTWCQPGSGSAAQVDVAQKRFVGSHNQCFVNEVSIMADLEHPNVVRFLYYATDRRSCSIVMELMDEDLHDMMRRRRLEGHGTLTGPFSMDDAIHVILQIAQGMEYVHRKNVVHRDLKSCNILIKNAIEGRRLEVKVADFGLSKKLKPRRTVLETDLGVGTVRWMAPEVLSLEEDSYDVHLSSSKYDPFKSDVYSFGMVCYEILVGRVPFYDLENLDEVKKIVLGGGRPTLPEWTPSNLKVLVENCWQTNASRRHSFVEIIEELTQSRVHTKPKTLIGRFYH